MKKTYITPESLVIEIEDSILAGSLKLNNETTTDQYSNKYDDGLGI